MRRNLIRPLLAALALGVWWLLVLAWAARVAPGDPWLAASQLTRSGNDAQSIFGVASIGADGMRIEALGPDDLALQSWRLQEPISARQYGVLRYRVEDFPRSMELALIFRRADQPGDVVSVSLPSPGGGADAAIDLDRIESWQGEIVEIGFSEYPAVQFANLQLPFDPYVIGHIRIESRSWAGLLRALFTDWFAYVPWSQRSINALGRDARWPHPRAVLPVMGGGLAGSVLLLCAIFAVRTRKRALRIVMWVIAAGWLLVDARWLWVLSQRQQAAQMVYAGKPWDQRKALQMDSDLMQFATRVSAMVQAMAGAQKILLWSGSSFDEGRLAYHLRPLNVAVLAAGVRADALPDGSLLVIEDHRQQWQYAADSGELRGPSWDFTAQRIYQHDSLSLYRLDPGAGP